MAKNYLVINSQFKPFSYAEMLQPLAQATEAHQSLEDQYSDLSTKSNIWEELANEQADPYAYSLYNKYSTDLKAQAEILAKEGLTPSARQSMLDMRNRYSKEIIPIENAYARREEEAKAQQQLLNEDSSIIFDRTAGVTSLDDYLRNPNLGYNTLSVNEVYSTAARDFSETAKKMSQEGKWRTVLGGQYWEQINRSGATPEQITALIAGDPNAPQELKDLYNNTLSSYTSRGQWDERGKAAIKDAIDRAAIYGIGEVSTKMQQNQEYLNPLQRQQKALNDLKLRDILNPPSEEGKRLPYDVIPRTTVDGKTKTSVVKKDLDFLDMIIANPSMAISQGLKPTSTFKPVGSVSVYQKGESEEVNPFTKRLLEISKKYPNLNFKIETNSEGQYVPSEEFLESYAEIQKEVSMSAVRDFNYPLKYTDNKLVNEVVERTLRGSMSNDRIPLYEYDGDKISNKRYTQRDYKKINFDTGNISYDPAINKILYTYEDVDKNIKTAVIDTEVLDDKDRSLYKIQKAVEKAKEEGSPEELNMFIHTLMLRLDGKFNTLAPIQSTTDSKLKDVTLD